MTTLHTIELNLGAIKRLETHSDVQGTRGLVVGFRVVVDTPPDANGTTTEVTCKVTAEEAHLLLRLADKV